MSYDLSEGPGRIAVVVIICCSVQLMGFPQQYLTMQFSLCCIILDSVLRYTILLIT